MNTNFYRLWFDSTWNIEPQFTVSEADAPPTRPLIGLPVIKKSIVITIYSPSYLFGLRVNMPSVYHTRRMLYTVPLIVEGQARKL